jgi:hypothetical protein
MLATAVVTARFGWPLWQEQRAVLALECAAREKNENDFDLAVASLEQVRGGGRVIFALSELASTSDDTIRFWVIRHLGRVCVARHEFAPALIDAVEDKHPRVASAARSALRQ